MLTTCVITQFLFILLLNLGALNVHHGLAVGCHDAEREALLKFKESLTDPANRLSSWKGKDCCDWEGVGCHNVTAFVTHLHLPNSECSSYGYDDSDYSLIVSELNPSLLKLSQLSYLDLSCSDSVGSPIPKFIGSFKYLTYLNLSYSNFAGVVPSQLGNLTRLQTLSLTSFDDDIDLSSFDFDNTDMSYLSIDLHWVSKLANLQYLDIGGSYIFHSNNSRHALNMPPSLRALYLNQCQNLDNPLLLRLLSNSTWLARIQQLGISGNSLGGTLPYVLANMTSLTHLELANNKLNGSIPLSVTNMKKLEYLDLSSNSFSRVEGGAIMGILGNLCKLRTFDLSFNSIGGSIEASHKNISKCASYHLEYLSLGQNMIGGTLPSWLGDFKYLRELDINNNTINGPIPISIGRLSYLEYLDLSYNTLNGTLPQSLGQCKSLVHIDLSFNNLTGTLPQGLGRWKSLVHIDLSSNFLNGVVSESHLDNLSRLEYLDLSYNNVVEWNITSNWSPPFQLSWLNMASCKIQSQFPRWIGEQTELDTLDFSANNISGELPQCFTSNHLTYINISHNRITGPVPYFYSTYFEAIDLSFNLLSGSLILHGPSAKNDTINDCWADSEPLEYINLSSNNLSGTIPDCWTGLQSVLGYINLASNNLSGTIPLSMGLLKLTLLKLSENSLYGPIPSTLSTQLLILDLGENKLVGNIQVIGEDKLFLIYKCSGYEEISWSDLFHQHCVISIHSNSLIFP